MKSQTWLAGIIVIVVTASIPEMYCHNFKISCGDIQDCSFYRCLERYVDCNVLESPVRQYMYLCEKLENLKRNYSEEIQQFTERIINCTFHNIMTANPLNCERFAQDSSEAFKYCFDKESTFLENLNSCHGLGEFTNAIFSPDVRTLQYARIAGEHYWDVLVRSRPNSMEVLKRCNTISDNIHTSLATSKGLKFTQQGKLELVIIVDSSESIGEYLFDRMKTKISEFIWSLSNNLHIGVVRYSSTVETISGLVSASDRHKLINRIQKMAFTGGTTSTEFGLLRARTLFSNYTENCSCLRIQRRSILIVTDGVSNDMLAALQTAHELKESHLEVEICVLAVGQSIHELQLSQLASRPMSVYLHRLVNFDNPSLTTEIFTSLQNYFDHGPKIVDANKCQEFTLSVNESIVETIHIRNIPKKSSLKVINAEEIIIYGSHVKVPNWITAEFLVTTPNATYFLNNYENIFLTILSRSNQGAPYKLAVDVAVHSSLNTTVEASSTGVTHGSEVEIVCSVQSSGLLTFIWHDLSHGIIFVDIVASSEERMKSIITRQVYKNSTFQCVVHENGFTKASRTIIIESPLFTTLPVVEEGTALLQHIMSRSTRTSGHSTYLLLLCIVTLLAKELQK